MRRNWRMVVLGAAALVVASAAAANAQETIPGSGRKCGDANNDSSLQIGDVVLHLRRASLDPTVPALCGGDPNPEDCLDRNGNGMVDLDIPDVTLNLNRASGIRNCNPDICDQTPVTHTCGNDLPKPVSGGVYNVPAGCAARINGLTYVDAGSILNISQDVGATTPITARVGGVPDTSVLVVKPGGRINVQGESGSPVLFTSANSPGGRAAEDWGGIVILGNAPVNSGSGFIEGLPETPDTQFGGSDATDFSGCISYARIEFGGKDFALDNELNLLVFGGVGNTTRVDHVHAHRGADDPFEWFGGTVNAKYLIATATGDDNLDTQLGYRGAVQYAFVVQEHGTVESGGSNCFEMDNSEFNQTATPNSFPKFCNVTCVGVKDQQGGNPPGGNDQFGVLSRRGNAMWIANSVIMQFSKSTVAATGGGVTMRDAPTAANACTNSTTLKTTSPFGRITNTIFFDNGDVDANTGVKHYVNHSSCVNGGACTCSTEEWMDILDNVAPIGNNTVGRSRRGAARRLAALDRELRARRRRSGGDANPVQLCGHRQLDGQQHDRELRRRVPGWRTRRRLEHRGLGRHELRAQLRRQTVMSLAKGIGAVAIAASASVLLSSAVISATGPGEPPAPRVERPADFRLSNASPSVEHLLGRLLDALAKKDAQALHRLRVTKQEYRDFVVPGNVEPGQPPRNAPAESIDFHWGMLNTLSGYTGQVLLNNYGGHTYKLGPLPTWEKKRYAWFEAYEFPPLPVQDEDGRAIDLRVGSIIEVDGQYKFVGFRGD